MTPKVEKSYKIIFQSINAATEEVQSRLDDAFDLLLDEVYKELCIEEEQAKNVNVDIIL